MTKIMKRIKSVFLLAKYQPKSLITLSLYPTILIGGSLISILPMLIGYKNWAEVEAIQVIMSWVTVILSVLFSLAYIKYIQESLLGRTTSIFEIRRRMPGKWFDGIVMTIKYGIIAIVLRLGIQFEMTYIVRIHRFKGYFDIPMTILLLTSVLIAGILINRLGLHKQMAILKGGEGNYSIREAFRSTKEHWRELVPLSIIETVMLIWPGVIRTLDTYFEFKYESAVFILIASFVLSIPWMYFETVYKVSCYTEYQAMHNEL